MTPALHAIRRATAAAAVVVAAGHAVLVQLDTGAPARQPPETPPPLVLFANGINRWAQQLDAASAGRNVGLHVRAIDDPMYPADVYYLGNYDLYPRRVYAGVAGRVINGTPDLMGPWPDPAALRRLDVGGTVDYPAPPP